MTYNQRDIVLIPIPFTDLSSNKRRPVIIISNDKYNDTSPDMVVVALTSNLAFKTLTLMIRTWKRASFPKKSRIRCDKIYTLSKNIVVKKFNRIHNDTLGRIREKIDLLIADENQS